MGKPWIYSVLMGVYSDSMGFYSDLMGYEWDLPSGYVNSLLLNIFEHDHRNSGFSQL